VRLQREVALILVQCPSHGDDRKLGDFSWENLGKFMDILWTSMEINCVWKTIIGLVNQFFFFATPLLLLQFDQVFCLNIPALV